MIRKKWFWILGFIILVAGGGGFYFYATNSSAVDTASAQQPAMQTAVARRGELIITASGTGQVSPASQVGVGFDESGTLIELKVGIGDTVHAGDVLARLQTNNTPQEIAASVSDAELVVIKAQQSLDDLIANAGIARTEAMNSIATYAQEVRDAQYTLENYSMPIFMQGMDAIQAVDLTKAQLDAAWAAFEPYKYYAASNETRQALLVALNLAQSNYDAAVKRLNYEYALQVAQANLDKARREYEQYKDGPAATELILAQTELANAQARLALAKETKSIADLVAPIDGTVMSVDASVGEALGATAIITLADLEHLQIEVYLDETDLDKAAVGYQAEVIFDALPDQTFKGQVVTVSPGLETVGNVQAVKVIVLLDDTGSAKLPVGLNASVDIIAGLAENAVLIPIEALREIEPGEYAVFVIEDGTPVLRVVQVGLQDITSAEILSGVQAGDTVTTGITQTR